jgi:cytochrome c553
VSHVISRSWTGALGLAMLLAACSTGAVAVAAEKKKPPAPPATVPPEAVTCQACHGVHGEGMADGDEPRIAGQSAYYLDKQLRDFASGARDNPIMGAIAKGLSEQTRSKLVGYYASLPTPAPLKSTSPTAAQSSLGHQLALEGSEAKRVQACNNCHGPDGSGVALSAPGLAGQWGPYLAAQLKSWQRGGRKNDAGSLMTSVAARLDDADIAAVTSYYAGLDPTAH